MSLSIKDIARISGVGISTVSRVMNNSGSVGESTRKKVMEVITANNFVPNNNARNLKIRQSNNIGIFVKGITNPFFNTIINVIEHQAALRGNSLLIQNVDSASNELEVAIKEAQNRNICGVILLGGYFAYSEEQFRKLGVPCVLLTVSAGEDVDLSLYSSVCIDDEKAGFKVTEYLINLGHRRIGFLYKSLTNLKTPNTLRYEGYVRALETYGISVCSDLVAGDLPNIGSGFKVGFQLAKQLIQKNRDMTAIFAFADVLAIGAAKAALSMGIRIPDHLSIVGFDGIDMAEYYNPSLDTVSQSANEMALTAVEILYDMFQHGKSRHVVFDSILLKRGSSKSII